MSPLGGSGAPSGVAALLLAHNDPAHVRRLIDVLTPDLDVFVHCDAKTPAPVHTAMTAGLAPSVRLVRRHDTRLSSWSLVEAELEGLREVLRGSDAAHVAVLSGADYPLVSAADLVGELSGWRGISRMRMKPLPYRNWNTPRNADGGMWRFRRRFLTRRGQVLYARGVPLRTPWRRTIPRDLVLHASSQWKVYAREHVELVLRVLDERADLRRFWRGTLVPDESCVASVLGSPALCGTAAENIVDELAWLIEWETGGDYHPRYLGMDDLPALEKAHAAMPVDPVQALRSEGRSAPWEGRKLFARKFSSAQSAVLDEIDRRLLV